MVRGPQAIVALFSRPVRTFERWDSAVIRRPVFGLAALDAHANIPWRDGDEPRTRSALARPSYETMFRTVAQSVRLDGPLSGDPARDADRVLSAIARGASFSIIRAMAEPASLEFSATYGAQQLVTGGRTTGGDGDVTVRASVPQAPGARVTVMLNSQPVSSGLGRAEFTGRAIAGVYRAEVTLPSYEMPWIVSNPIVIEAAQPPLEPDPWPNATLVPLPIQPADWPIERDPSSSASVAVDGLAMKFAYQLGPGQPSGQYAALARRVDMDRGVDRIQFVARADHPTRISVQVRLPGGAEGQRWRRSVFVDTTPRTFTVGLQEFDPADAPTSRRPVVAQVQSLLFVVDTLNSRPDTGGVVWISDVGLGTREP